MDAAMRAAEALKVLKEVQEEYRKWYDNIPENFENMLTSQLLEAVIDLDIEGAWNTVDMATAVDLPLGYGRD